MTKKTKAMKIIQFFQSSCTRLPAADITGESQPNFHDLHHQVVEMMMIWWLGWFGDGVHDDLVIGDGGHFYDNIDEDNKLTSSNRSSLATMGQLVTWIGFWEPYMCQSRLLDFMQCFQMCLEKNHKCESHCVIEIYWSNKIQSTYNAASTSFPRLNEVDIREYGKGGSSQE